MRGGVGRGEGRSWKGRGEELEGVKGGVGRGERSWKGRGEELEGARGGVGRGEGRSWKG